MTLTDTQKTNPTIPINGVTLIYAVSLALATLMFSLKANAQGEKGTRVLVAKNTEMSGFELRIKAELEAAGFIVELFTMDFREDTRRVIDIRADARNAAAAIVCRTTQGFVEIWITDKVTNKSVLRRIPIPTDEDAEAFVAISTVELLRASLLEIHTASHLTGIVAPTKEIEALIAPRQSDSNALMKNARIQEQESKFSLQINPAIMILRFQGNPQLNMQISGALAIHNHIEMRLHGQIPIIANNVTADEGEISINTGYMALGAGWVPVYPERLVSCDIGGGMALLIHSIQARPLLINIKGNESRHFVLSPHLLFGIDIRLVKKIRLRVESMAGWMLRQISIKVDGHDGIEERELVNPGNFFVSIGLGFTFLI